MKINEVIQEGVWDNLKTAGQNVKQGVGAVANKVGQGARSAYNTVVQPGARQQRFSQAATQQFEPKKLLGKEYSPQQQLRRQNLGTYAGDVARTIGQAQGGVGGGSMMAKATPTIPNKSIPVGATLEIPELGTFTMTAQGWHTDTKQPVKDLAIVNKLNAKYYQGNQDQAEPAQQTQTPPPNAGKSPGPNFVWNGSLWVPK
jgi:hypothetical protein